MRIISGEFKDWKSFLFKEGTFVRMNGCKRRLIIL